MTKKLDNFFLFLSKKPRSRHCSLIDRNTETGGSRTRHLSMQDRLELYNRDLEEASSLERVERVRKTSVVFDQPITMTGDVVESDSERTEAEVHQVRLTEIS